MHMRGAQPQCSYPNLNWNKTYQSMYSLPRALPPRDAPSPFRGFGPSLVIHKYTLFLNKHFINRPTRLETIPPNRPKTQRHRLVDTVSCIHAVQNAALNIIRVLYRTTAM
jgi:hypothetical protein